MLNRLRHLLLGAALAGLLAGAAGAAPAHAYPFNLSVTRQPVTRPLASNFLGLALEYSTVPAWVAVPHQPANSVLPALLRGLDPTGRPSIRIGGQSTERSWWPVPGMARPIGVTASLGQSWIEAAQALVADTDAKLMLGVNLEAGSPRIAQVEADALVKGVGAANVSALEIGNEPDLYRFVPWYRSLDGRSLPWFSHDGAPEYSRSTTWSPDAFVAQFRQFAAVLPHLPLAGPETAPGPWLDAFDTLLSRHSQVRTLTTHAYGLNSCDKDPENPLYPTIPHLLSLTASRGLYAGMAPSIALAHRDGAEFRVDEMGSITCNGRFGVSNTFASALWAMDALFDADRLGIDGVNLHSFPNSSNGLFDFTYYPSTHRWRATIHPLYDGALMFARAAPAGSRLLRIATPAQTYLRTWATIGADHNVRVLLVNDSVTSSAQVTLHDPSGYTTSVANVQRLAAHAVGATSGVTLGGVPVSTTTTGIVAPPALTSLAAHGGTRTVTVPAGSATLVTIPPDTAPAAGATPASRSR